MVVGVLVDSAHGSLNSPQSERWQDDDNSNSNHNEIAEEVERSVRFRSFRVHDFFDAALDGDSVLMQIGSEEQRQQQQQQQPGARATTAVPRPLLTSGILPYSTSASPRRRVATRMTFGADEVPNPPANPPASAPTDLREGVPETAAIAAETERPSSPTLPSSPSPSAPLVIVKSRSLTTLISAMPSPQTAAFAPLAGGADNESDVVAREHRRTATQSLRDAIPPEVQGWMMIRRGGVKGSSLKDRLSRITHRHSKWRFVWLDSLNGCATLYRHADVNRLDNSIVGSFSLDNASGKASKKVSLRESEASRKGPPRSQMPLVNLPNETNKPSSNAPSRKFRLEILRGSTPIVTCTFDSASERAAWRGHFDSVRQFAEEHSLKNMLSAWDAETATCTDLKCMIDTVHGSFREDAAALDDFDDDEPSTDDDGVPDRLKDLAELRRDAAVEREKEQLFSIELKDVHSNSVTLREVISASHPTIVVLLRHFGCMLCRQLVGRLVRKKKEFDSLDMRMVVIGNGDSQSAAEFKKEFNFKGKLLVDTHRHLYRALCCNRGVRVAVGGKTMRAAKEAYAEGYRQGGTTGDPLQLGGVFVITRNEGVVYAHREAWAGDPPPLDEIVHACKRHVAELDGWTFTPADLWDPKDTVSSNPRAPPDQRLVSLPLPPDWNVEFNSSTSELGDHGVLRFQQNNLLTVPLIASGYLSHFFGHGHTNWIASTKITTGAETYALDTGTCCVSVLHPADSSAPEDLLAIVRCPEFRTDVRVVIPSAVVRSGAKKGKPIVGSPLKTRGVRRWLRRRFPDLQKYSEWTVVGSGTGLEQDSVHSRFCQQLCEYENTVGLCSGTKFKFGLASAGASTAATACDERTCYAENSPSVDFWQFCDVVGDKVTMLHLSPSCPPSDRTPTETRLHGFTGGLDSSDQGHTGPTSYATTIRPIGRDLVLPVMWHVAPLIVPRATESPSRATDMRVERKLHLGNDVVVVIFNDSHKPVDVSTFRSQFNQAFVIVQPNPSFSGPGVVAYSTAIVTKPGVPRTASPLPVLVLDKSDKSSREQIQQVFLSKLSALECASSLFAPKFGERLTNVRRSALHRLAMWVSAEDTTGGQVMRVKRGTYDTVSMSTIKIRPKADAPFVAPAPIVTDELSFSISIAQDPRIVDGFLKPCLKYLSHISCIRVEGLLRITSVSDIVGKLVDDICNSGFVIREPETLQVDTSREGLGPHAVASVLKFWMKRLPEPLVPRVAYEPLVAIGNALAGSSTNLAGSSTLEDLISVARAIFASDSSMGRKVFKHPAQREALALVCLFLSDVVEHSDSNGMTAPNLATVLTSLIMQPPVSGVAALRDIQGCLCAVMMLIRHAKKIFRESTGPGESFCECVVRCRFPFGAAASKDGLAFDEIDVSFLGAAFPDPLSVSVGDIIIVTDMDDGEGAHESTTGWWTGQNVLTGQKGGFPSDFVEILL